LKEKRSITNLNKKKRSKSQLKSAITDACCAKIRFQPIQRRESDQNGAGREVFKSAEP
jgi:hypothetical protein